MVKIRLRRDGAKKAPYYTMVVADSRYPMDGRQIQWGSKLTVRESQVAIFLNKGKITYNYNYKYL